MSWAKRARDDHNKNNGKESVWLLENRSGGSFIKTKTHAASQHRVCRSQRRLSSQQQDRVPLTQTAPFEPAAMPCVADVEKAASGNRAIAHAWMRVAWVEE